MKKIARLKKLFWAAIIAVSLPALALASESTLRQPVAPDGSAGAKTVTGTTSGDHYSIDVNLTSGTATIEALIAPFAHTTIATPITIAPSGVATYTLPAHPANGTYDIAVESTGVIYYAEDKVATSGARMVLRANEHTYTCEGNLCALPTNIQFSNPTAATVTVYVRTQYQ